jgi:hypothetical protein
VFNVRPHSGSYYEVTRPVTLTREAAIDIRFRIRANMNCGEQCLFGVFTTNLGHAVAQLVEALCATSRKVAGSIPDRSIGIFH